MAKPIRATPTLTGVEAIQFVKVMQQTERSPRPTSLDREFHKIIAEHKKLFMV
jgi:hypothetical protein